MLRGDASRELAGRGTLGRDARKCRLGAALLRKNPLVRRLAQCALRLLSLARDGQREQIGRGALVGGPQEACLGLGKAPLVFEGAGLGLRALACGRQCLLLGGSSLLGFA